MGLFGNRRPGGGGGGDGPSLGEFNNFKLEVNTKLTDADRQTSVLTQGVSVLSASANAPASVEIEGRTLIPLGNSLLEPGKKYVIADKKTKVIVDGVTHTGVGKFTKTGATGRGAIVRVADLEGKVSGSVVENPHTAKSHTGVTTSLLTPSNSAFGENSAIGYSQRQKLDGITSNTVNANNGASGQELYSFNLIEEVERNIGRIPRTTVADKVAWLRTNVGKLVANWHGFGSSVEGNKAEFRVYIASTDKWDVTIFTHPNSTVSKLVNTVNAVNTGKVIDANGFVHYLANALPSDSIIPSVINTDFIDLEIELSPNADFTHPKVPLYEVTDDSYNKIYVDWNEDEVMRRYPVMEGVQHLQGVGVVAEGENLLPPFTEWSINATGQVVGPHELVFDVGDSAIRTCSIRNIPVIPGQSYTISADSYNQMKVWTTDGLTNIANGITSTRTFAIPSNVTRIMVEIFTPATNGTHTLKNPMLTPGTTAKPFVPRNPSYLFADVKLGAIGTAKDALYEQDGRWLLRKVNEKDITIDGALSWVNYVAVEPKPDFKRFKATNGGYTANSDYTNNTAILVNEFSNKRKHSSTTGLIYDFLLYNNNHSNKGELIICVPNSDSGFDTTIHPLISEIKAYFYGWKMNNGTYGTNYDGIGTKTWIPIGDTSNARAVTVVPTTASPSQLDGTIQPYKLSYVLATPQVIDVTDKVEGALKVNGLTQVEVLSGVVFREKVVPFYFSPGNNYWINSVNAASGNTTSRTKHRAYKILGIQKDGVDDSAYWLTDTTVADSHGLTRKRITASAFDPTANYTVTYIALDKHRLTANPTNVKLTYAQNVRGSLNDISNKTQDNATTLSVHERAIVDLYVRVKALEVR